MLNKLFKKPEPSDNPSASPASTRGAAHAAPAADAAAGETAQLAAKAAWEDKLQEAMGNDTALLALAKDAPILEIKHAAVMALAGEEALRRAEREFRNNDRRVHRAAKQRYETLVQRREAGEQAAKLTESAAVLVHDANISSQRLVELDRAWQTLDAGLLEETQITGYSTLRAQLTTLFRERADHQLAVSRWCADARQAAAHLHAACVESAAAAMNPAAHCVPEAATERARSVLFAMPASDASSAGSLHADNDIAAIGEALRSAIALSAGVDARLKLLAELAYPQAAAAPTSEGEIFPPEGLDANPVAQPARSPSARWKALPPIADADVANVLSARFEDWRRTQAGVRETGRAEIRSRAKEQKQAENQQHTDALAKRVTEAETALAEGHLADAGKRLTAIDKDFGNSGAIRPLQARIDLVQAEFARLKGWQHWGGARAREDLVAEALALAKSCADEMPAGKLPVKAHADAIDKLRDRWKELDKLGGATSRALWQRFDTALKAAYVPVATHLAKLKAARQENLGARSKLISALNAIPLAGADMPAADGGNVEREQNENANATEITSKDVNANKNTDAAYPSSHAVQDWRELARALAHFQTEWRKLGPLEHTVPHKARQALVLRMEKSVARLEQPLQEARRVAQLKREQLIVRAKALAAEPTSAPPAAKPAHRGTTRNAMRHDNRNATPGKRTVEEPRGRPADRPAENSIAKVRELQIEWQSQAKEIPLARNIENALWAEFKAATDAVFTQRDALVTLRDAEFKANNDAREALIVRLSGLGADATPAAVKRTIAEVDLEWQKTGDASRSEAAKFEARFRAARDAAQHCLAGNAQRSWQLTCDTLSAKLALCEEAESSAPGADIEARWSAQPLLPAMWEKALQTRFKAGIENPARSVMPPSAQDALNTALLQLESDLDLASPPAFHAARRELKLRAMKNAIESRQAPGSASAGVEKMLAGAFAAGGTDAEARERLAAILAAVRSLPPENIR